MRSVLPSGAIRGLCILVVCFGTLAVASGGCAAGDDNSTPDPPGTGTPTAGTTSCEDRCQAGDRVCVSGGYQECNLVGDCFDWGPVIPCPAGATCQAGTCEQDTCTDECTEASAQCTATGIQLCELNTGTGCWVWGADTPCPGTETCSAGKCSADCTDECTDGSRECSGDGYRVCGNTDLDPCMDWGPATPCPDGQTCAGGYCESSCTNECTGAAEECVGTTGTHSCGDFDTDSCLEWGPLVPCPNNETCSNGSCSATCTDECPNAGAKQCTPSGDGFQICESSGGCLIWGLPTSCDQNETCTNGECEGSCDCDFVTGICEPDAPGSTTACACDGDCSGGSPCGSDGYCDTWCTDDPDCACSCDYNEYCEAASQGSTSTCSCDPDCELNEFACSDDGHCDTWCPSAADADCGVDACRARWMGVGFRWANETYLSGAYTDPDPYESSPWVLLSPGLSSGSAEEMFVFASENVACVDSMRVSSWGYDDSVFGDGAEMYLYNWDTDQYDLLPTETIGWPENIFYNAIADTAPYLLCLGDYCYVAVKFGASSWDNTHVWDMGVEVYMSP